MKTRWHLALAMAFGSSGTAACDCSLLDVRARLERSNVVFVGEVIPSDAPDSVAFRVAEQFKGEAIRVVRVAAQRNFCDYFPVPSVAEPGKRYLVFTTRHDGMNISRQCSGTAPVEEASGDLRSLRTRPVPLHSQ